MHNPCITNANSTQLKLQIRLLATRTKTTKKNKMSSYTQNANIKQPYKTTRTTLPTPTVTINFIAPTTRQKQTIPVHVQTNIIQQLANGVTQLRHCNRRTISVYIVLVSFFFHFTANSLIVRIHHTYT